MVFVKICIWGFLISLFLLACIYIYDYIENKINGNVIVTEKDIILYEGLIKNDMLNYYIVSLISSDNEDTQENWTKNKKELLKLKSFIEKRLIINKKHVQKQLNEAIEIVNNELKKYYGKFQ